MLMRRIIPRSTFGKMKNDEIRPIVRCAHTPRMTPSGGNARGPGWTRAACSIHRVPCRTTNQDGDRSSQGTSPTIFAILGPFSPSRNRKTEVWSPTWEAPAGQCWDFVSPFNQAASAKAGGPTVPWGLGL